MQAFDDRDLRVFENNGYKVAFILPGLSETDKKRCEILYHNIYRNLIIKHDPEVTFDATRQVVGARINGKDYTLLLAKHKGEQEELLKFSLEAYRSLSKLTDEGESFEAYKLMPSGRVLEMTLMPFCKFKKLTTEQKRIIERVIIKEVNKKDDLTLLMRENEDGQSILYFTKNFSCKNFDKDRLGSTNEGRAIRALRLFHNQAISCFNPEFFVDNNVLLLDYLGNLREGVTCYEELYRNTQDFYKPQSIDEIFDTTISPFDFDNAERPEGYAVFALKEHNKTKEMCYLPAAFRKSIYKNPIVASSLKFDLVKIVDKEYVAVMCPEEYLDYLVERASVIHSKIRANSQYTHDDKLFYYQDYYGAVTPLSCIHFGCFNPQRVSLNKFTSKVDEMLGKRTGYVTDYMRSGDEIEFYLKSNDEVGITGLSYNNLMSKKKAIQKAVDKEFGTRLQLQENDGRDKLSAAEKAKDEIKYSQQKY